MNARAASKEEAMALEILDFARSRGWLLGETITALGRVISCLILNHLRKDMPDDEPLTEEMMSRYETLCDEFWQNLRHAPNPEILPPNRGKAS